MRSSSLAEVDFNWNFELRFLADRSVIFSSGGGDLHQEKADTQEQALLPWSSLMNYSFNSSWLTSISSLLHCSISAERVDLGGENSN